jgi:uncharacterized protein YdaU (DUF1376 family)
MRPPAFQFYADDFVAGTVELTTHEIGAYMLLLCYQWSKGFIPDDDAAIRRIARLTQAFELANIRCKFRARRGKLFNLRLEHERHKQIEFREKQSKNGLKGGRPKNPSLSQPLPKHKAKKSSPSPSPSPSPKYKKNDKAYKGLQPAMRETAARFEAVLTDQWVNDAGKWVNRIKQEHQRCERVIAEVENAKKENRISTTPAQYAEQIWKEFK